MRKQASAHANTKETYYSICCCGIRTVIKPVLCQRNGYTQGGLYSEGKHFNLQSVKLTLLSFSPV